SAAARPLSAATYAGTCASGTPAVASAARTLGAEPRARTTSTSCGRLRKVSRRLPKWYASAPNGSGRRATGGERTEAWSRSTVDFRAWSVDAAHAVDRDLLDQGLGQGLILLGRGARGGLRGLFGLLLGDLLVRHRVAHAFTLFGTRGQKSMSRRC